MSLESEGLTPLRKQAVNTSAMNLSWSLATLMQAAAQWADSRVFTHSFAAR